MEQYLPALYIVLGVIVCMVGTFAAAYVMNLIAKVWSQIRPFAEEAEMITLALAVVFLVVGAAVLLTGWMGAGITMIQWHIGLGALFLSAGTFRWLFK